jgi:hypothetical protein
MAFCLRGNPETMETEDPTETTGILGRQQNPNWVQVVPQRAEQPSTPPPGHPSTHPEGPPTGPWGPPSGPAPVPGPRRVGPPTPPRARRAPATRVAPLPTINEESVDSGMTPTALPTLASAPPTTTHLADILTTLQATLQLGELALRRLEEEYLLQLHQDIGQLPPPHDLRLDEGDGLA